MDPEAIRQARLQKQQSRYRDRGGVFVPAETNPLLDILLARGPNGESPVKVAAQASQKRTASSPTRQQGSPKTPSPLKKGRGRAGSGSTRGSMGKGSRLKVKQAPSEEDELVKPAPKHNKQTRTTAAKKGVKPKAVADVSPEPVKSTRGRKSQITTPVANSDDDDVPIIAPAKAKRKRTNPDDQPPSSRTNGSSAAKNSANKRRKVAANDEVPSDAETGRPPVRTNRAGPKSKAVASDYEDDVLPQKAKKTPTTKTSNAEGLRRSNSKRPRGPDDNVDEQEDLPPPPKRRSTKNAALAASSSQLADKYDSSDNANTTSKHSSNETPKTSGSEGQTPSRARAKVDKGKRKMEVPVADAKEDEQVDPPSKKQLSTASARSTKEREKVYDDDDDANTVASPEERIARKPALSDILEEDEEDEPSTKASSSRTATATKAVVPARKTAKRIGLVEIGDDPPTKKPPSRSRHSQKNNTNDEVASAVIGKPSNTAKPSKSSTRRTKPAQPLDDDPQDAPDPESESEQAPKPTKKTKKAIISHVPPQEPVESNSATSTSKEKAQKPPSTSLVKPSSGLQKENSKSGKGKGRKPKPRMSMFPAAIIAESDDDPIDFLS